MSVHSSGCLPNCQHTEQNEKAMEAIGRDPQAAVQKLSAEPVDPGLLHHAINCLASQWSTGLRNAGITKVFIRMCMNGYEDVEGFHRSQCPWVIPLRGLSNVLAATIDNPSSVDESIRGELQIAFGDIIAVLQRSLRCLTVSDSMGDERRRTLAGFLLNCVRGSALTEKQMYDDGTTELVMRCFIYTSKEQHPLCSVLLHAIYVYHPGPAGDQSIDTAVRLVGVEVLNAKFRNVLGNPDLIDDDLRMELWCCVVFFGRNRPFVKSFFAGRPYEYILEALLRQQKKGCKREQRRMIYTMGNVILNALVSHAPCPLHFLVETIITGGLLEVVAESLCLVADFGDDRMPELCNRLITTALTQSEHPDDTVSLFQKAARVSMSNLYTRTLARLRAGSSPDNAVERWTTLGKALGLEEDGEGCRNLLCPLYGQDGKPMMLCSGCRSAQYCSRECQATDWKSHRKQCKTKKKE